MKITPITKRIIERICLIALIVIIASVATYFFTEFKPNTILLFSLGVAITSALNCLKIYMIELTAVKISNMSTPEAGKGYTYLMYIARYFLTIIVVCLVILVMFLITGESPFLTFEGNRSNIYDPMIIGLIIGLFTLKIAVMTIGKDIE